jgi:hypothetical protein
MSRQPRAFGALVGAVGFLAGSSALADNSFLTHLATGRLIWSGAGFPHEDPYSFTAVGEPWVVQSWFASVIFGAVDDLWGLAGLRILFGILIGTTLVGCWSLTRPAGALVRRVGAIVPVLVLAVEGWDERPYVFAFGVLVVALLASEGRIDPRWLVPAGWLWVNTHGSWPLGILAVGSLWAGARFDRGSGGAEWRSALWLGGGMVAGIANPYTFRLLAFPATAISRRDVFRDIKEWQAPTFDNTAQYAFILVLLLAVVAVTRRPRWRAVVPLVVFVPLALTSARNLDVAALVLLPGIAAGLAGAEREPDRLRLPALPLAAAAAALLVVGVLRVGPSDDFNDAPYPVAATDWLEDHGVAPTDGRVIAREYVGNYFEARYGTDAEVFVDDRFELFPLEVLRDARTLSSGGPGWGDVLERYDADAIVWEVRSPLGELLALAEGWRITYEDEKWLVAVPG